MATHTSVLAWRIPQRSLVGYSPWDHKSRTRLSAIIFFLMRNVPFMHMVLNVLHLGVLSVMWTEWGATRLE